MLRKSCLSKSRFGLQYDLNRLGVRTAFDVPGFPRPSAKKDVLAPFLFGMAEQQPERSMPKRLNPRSDFPDPYYTAKKIRELHRYVEKNKTIRIHQVPLAIIHSMLLQPLRSSPTFCEDEVFSNEDPTCFCCMSVFHQIYLTGYREPDFASFDTFQLCFAKFQHYLWLIATAYRQHGSWIHEKLPQLKLFDVKNLTENVNRMKRWNYERQYFLGKNEAK